MAVASAGQVLSTRRGIGGSATAARKVKVLRPAGRRAMRCVIHVCLDRVCESCFLTDCELKNACAAARQDSLLTSDCLNEMALSIRHRQDMFVAVTLPAPNIPSNVVFFEGSLSNDLGKWPSKPTSMCQPQLGGLSRIALNPTERTRRPRNNIIEGYEVKHTLRLMKTLLRLLRCLNPCYREVGFARRIHSASIVHDRAMLTST